jgi:hypothetical protein
LENSPIRTHIASEKGRIALPPADICRIGSGFIITMNSYKTVTFQVKNLCIFTLDLARLGVSAPAFTASPYGVRCYRRFGGAQDVERADGLDLDAAGCTWTGIALAPVLAAVAALT